MPGVNVIVGNDASNDLQGSAGKDLIYGFDPNGPQGQTSSIAATRVASGLTQPLFATAAPGDSQRLFVVEQTGAIKIVDLTTGQLLATPFLTTTVDSSGERGLLGMAFDPDYATNGFFYIYRTVPGATPHNAVERYHVSANPDIADPASGTAVINLDNLGATNHNAGWIGFGADNDLYIATGENANAPNAQTLSNLLGKILRIDVHSDAFPADPAANYAIPSDNPFVGTAGARGEIYALGLRNPFRDSFDRATGDFFIADVGQNTIEEINPGIKGANYGWPNAEGPSNNPAFTNPIFFYDHTVGQAVIGGYAYRGTSEGLQGQYFYADEVAGKVFTLQFNGSTWVSTERTSQITTDTGAINSPTSFGEDAKGNLYIVDYDGDVFRLTPQVVSADRDDTLRGFAGDDIMFGGSGNDLLDGGAGKDVMTGGPGDDRFVFSPGYGADLLTDFVAGARTDDRIDLTAFGNLKLSYVLGQTTQAGADALIDLGNGDTIALLGVSKDNLYIDDFIGVTKDNRFQQPALKLASFSPAAGDWTSDDLYPRQLADINGDHMADIVGFGSAGVYVALATGNGNFASPTFVLSSFGVSAAAGGWSNDNLYHRDLADVNGDHMADIIGFGGNGVYVALAAGNGNFASPTFVLNSFGPADSAGGWINDNLYPRDVADVNGDGIADIVGFGSAGVYVALATGNGNFAAPSFTFNAFGSSDAAGGWRNDNTFHRELADVNGDGKADIVGFGGAGVYVALATTNGNFAQAFLASNLFGTTAAAGGWTSQDQFPRHLADVNGDHKADIVGFGGDYTYVAFGNSDGTFGKPAPDIDSFGYHVAAGGWSSNDTYPRELGDVTGDGLADIAGFGNAGVYISEAHLLL
jgi:glucose/arabinose dehydrogenase